MKRFLAKLPSTLLAPGACKGSAVRAAAAALARPHLAASCARGAFTPVASVHTQPAGQAAGSSVDADEIQRFSRTAAEWWDPHGQYELLHRMNPVRIKYVRDMLQQFGGPELARAEATTAAPFAGLRILDIGCGGGFVSEVATTHYRRDPALARGPGSIDYRHTTAESLVEQEEQFDVVVALEIIEHVNDPKQFVRTCSQLVKPEGMLIFSTINRTPASYLFTILLAEHLLRWVPVGTHTHDKYIMPEELELYLKMAGCQPLDVSGMGYNPLLKSWTLVSKSQPGNLEMNYILAARKSIL